MRLSTRVPSTSQLRTLEAGWIDSCHPDWGLVLMEIAGRHAAECAAAMWQQDTGGVVVICGSGNNGGDGMVVARYLHLWGIPVAVYALPARQNKRSGARLEAAVNRQVVERLGVELLPVEEGGLGRVGEALAGASLVVDALLGTGIDRPVEGLVRSLIDMVNNCGKPVLAVDLPSGVHSDSGQVMGSAVRADATVTFGYLKAGLLQFPGAGLCGKITVVDIGLPTFDQYKFPGGDRPQWRITTAGWVRRRLPDRPEDAHKGTFGHLLTVAGSAGMSGASILAGKSGLRAGAGLSILATPRSLIRQLPPQEVIYRGIAETEAGSIGEEAAAELAGEQPQFSAMVLGPGLSQNAGTVKFVHRFVPAIELPCVIDADGLNAMGEAAAGLLRNGRRFVLTPHPKELSRLIGLTVAEIQADRLGCAQKAAGRFNCVVVLKGARTVVAGPEEAAFINPSGNSAMATAGSGDVLSGVIGGLLAQGMPPLAAAVAGVYIHGGAGDMAANAIGSAGIVAGDIMAFVPTVISQLRSGDFEGSPLEIDIFGGQPR